MQHRSIQCARRLKSKLSANTPGILVELLTMTDTDIQGVGKSGDTSLKANAREGSPAASRRLDGDKKVSKHDHTRVYLSLVLWRSCIRTDEACRRTWIRLDFSWNFSSHHRRKRCQTIEYQRLKKRAARYVVETCSMSLRPQSGGFGMVLVQCFSRRHHDIQKT